MSKRPKQNIDSTSNITPDQNANQTNSNVASNIQGEKLSIKKSVEENQSKNFATLEEKLTKLHAKIDKFFKIEFINSLLYLIKLEYHPQASFETNLIELEWKKLDYLMQQLKKICKNKKHILALINMMQIHKDNEEDIYLKHKMPIENNKETNNGELNSNKIIDAIYDYPKSVSEMDTIDSSSDGDYFSLISIMIRFLYKLIMSTLNIELMKKMFDQATKIIELALIFLSCLADLCFYEEIRIQVISDSNLKCLFELFGSKTTSDLDEDMKKSNISNNNTIASSSQLGIKNNSSNIEIVKQFWCKMCRLAGNLCMEKNSKKIRNLFTNDFLKSLSKCIEKQQIFDKAQLSTSIASNDLDFYHSLLRFLRYGCELTCCKSIILENRLLVHICKIIHKLSMNISLNKLASSDNKTYIIPKERFLLEQKTKTVPSTEEKNIQLMNKIKDLTKQYLVILESWPIPLCSEYYNQIIEGNSIETLLYIYHDATDFKETPINQTKLDETSNTSTHFEQKKTSQAFNFTEFSFNLLYKLCYGYPNCRSEFGRVGGLVKILNKIEAFHSSELFTSTVISTQEYERLVEMICLSCKEVTNRSRLREQGFLINLVKHQQKLFKINSTNKNNNLKINKNTFESKLHNKLLVALCYFVYDQDSLNILLTNGLIDSLIAYLNESLYLTNNEISNKKNRYISTKTMQNFKEEFFILFQEASKKLVCLRKLLDFNKTTQKDNVTIRKRKMSDSNIINSNISNASTAMFNLSTNKKRRKLADISPPPLTPISQAFQIFPSPSYQPKVISPNSYSPEQFQFTSDRLQQSTSPSESYCSLSPQPNAFSPALSLSSPTQLTSRCQSAIMFTNTNTNLNLTYQNSFSASNLVFSNLSPSSSSSCLSPYLFSPNSFNDVDQQISNANIQFSPSIKNENSSDEESLNESDSDLEEKKENESVSVTEIKFDKPCSNSKLGKEIEVEPVYLKFDLSNSPIHNINYDMNTLSKSMTQFQAQQSIESINRTEACVFYVLGQLSHGDKPSSHIITNFDSILICLLNYLKYAEVRNPRALRILNRMTKNEFCFYNFVLAQFPYKVKKIFYDDINLQNSSLKDRSTIQVEENMVESSNFKSNTQFSKQIQKSSSTNTFNINHCYSFTNSTNDNSQEKNIEKEMNIYLNSNKAFFDAHTYFPSFESIEFTLCNNLKSLCMSSSDHGFSCLTSMMKNTQRKNEQISCALVAPFILRNVRALNYIMVELNGIDLILDSLFSTLALTLDDLSKSSDGSLKFKAIVCVQRILSFVGYKRDIKQITENFEAAKEKLFEKNAKSNSDEQFMPEDNVDYVCFLLGQEEETKKLKIKREMLTNSSEYFNALLNGHFVESLKRDTTNIQTLKLTDVSYEAFFIITELLQIEQTNNLSNTLLTYNLSFDLCIELILTCDKFFLFDLRDLFVSILVCNFLNLSTWHVCFQLAFNLNNSFLTNASIDCLLSKLKIFPVRKSKLFKTVAPSPTELDEAGECFSNEIADTTSNDTIENEYINFEDVFDYLLESLNELYPQNSSNQFPPNGINYNENSNPIVDYFRKNLKYGLCEIIKNNNWKF